MSSRKQRKSFFAKKTKPTSDQLEALGYSFEFDEDLIQRSITSQYHFLKSELEEISHSDYYNLVEGLNGDTPLCNVIRIRKERDPKTIMKMSGAEISIRVNWQSYLNELRDIEEGR